MIMLLDLIVGIAASLIASVIVGFLGHKAVSKQNSIILKLYVLFLSITTFICGCIVSIVLNEDFRMRIAKISEANLLVFYQRCIRYFVLILCIIAFLTLIVIGIEAFDRGERRDNKNSIDRLKLLK